MAATFAGVIEDVNTLRDPDASGGQKALAAFSLLTEAVSPISLRDGKAIGRFVGAIDDASDGRRAVSAATGAFGGRLKQGSGDKLRQQIRRFRDTGGQGGREEFLAFANKVAERARASGNVVSGQVGRGQNALPNATIFRDGNTFVVVDAQGAIRSFVPDANPDTGIVLEFIKLGGKL